MYVIIAIVIFIGMYFIVPYGLRNILRARFIARVKQSNRVCLTFDDGPNPESTPVLLSLLEELNVQATFFLIGKNVERHPDLLREIVKHGHEIGDHGYKHIHAWACCPFLAVVDLFRGHRILKQSLGFDHFWLRPPYGKLNMLTLLYVWVYKRKIAFWNVDPRDYIPQPPVQLYTEVLKSISGGSVILLHEKTMLSEKTLVDNMVAIKIIIQALRARGYTISKVSDAIQVNNLMPEVESVT